MNRSLAQTFAGALVAGLLACSAAALDFTVIGSFETGFISPEAPRSIAVSAAEGIYLLSFADGSVYEVTQDLETANQVLPPKEAPAGRIVPTPGYLGLALIRPLGLFASILRWSSSGIDFYERWGRSIGDLTMHGVPGYGGLFFEENDPIGDLHALYQNSLIEVWRMERILWATRPRTIWIPPDVSLRVDGFEFEENPMTGLVYMVQRDVYFLSDALGEIFALGRGPLHRPEETKDWWGETLAETDLRPLGLTRVDDITWDPENEILYAVDSVQQMVFALELSGRRPLFHRGDPDGTSRMDIGDAVFLLSYLFREGTAPTCLESADVDNNGKLEITDPIQLLQFLFLGAEPPATPGPPGAPCGPELDIWDAHLGLGCKEYSGCE